MTDLSGCWTGNYAYPGSLHSISFTAELQDSGGLVAGVIVEEGAGLGWPCDAQATISGHHDGATLTFTKVYDSHDQFLEAIFYVGTIGDYGHEVSGTWTIEADWSGPFVMSRPKRAKNLMEVEVGATV